MHHGHSGLLPRFDNIGGTAKVDQRLNDAGYKADVETKYGINSTSDIDEKTIWVFIEDAVTAGIHEMLNTVYNDIIMKVKQFTTNMDVLIKDMTTYDEMTEMDNAFYMYV